MLETPSPRSRWGIVGWIFVVVTAAIYGVLLFLSAHARWENFDPALFDYGKVAQILEGPFLRGVAYPDPVYYYVWIYVPYVLLLFPFYALFRCPEVLMVWHATVHACCLPLLYLWGRRLFRSPLPAVAIALLFVFSPLVGVHALFGMKGESLFIALFLLAAYLAHTERWRGALVISLLACFTKIDALPVLACWGGYHCWRGNGLFGRRLLMAVGGMLLLMIAGAGVMYLATGVPMRVGQLHLAQAAGDSVVYLRGGWQQAALFIQWLFLPFLAPTVLLLGLFNFLYLLYSLPAFNAVPEIQDLLVFHNPLAPQAHTEFSILLGVYFLALLLGAGRLLDRLGDRLPRVSRRLLENGLAVVLLLTGWLGYAAFPPDAFGPLPLTGRFDAAAYRATPRDRLAWEMVARLPPEEQGVVSSAFFERAWHSNGVRRLSTDLNFANNHRYVLLDLFAYSADMPREIFLEKTREALNAAYFQLTDYKDGILLLTYGEATAENARLGHWIDAHHDLLSRNFRSPEMYLEMIGTKGNEQTE